MEETGRWLQWASKTLPGLGGSDVEKVVVREIREMLPQAGRGYVRLAGVSGALAVALGAYGAHGVYKILEFLRSFPFMQML